MISDVENKYHCFQTYFHSSMIATIQEGIVRGIRRTPSVTTEL